MTGRPTDDATAHELLRLERALAARDHAAVAGGLAALFDAEFLEFGASGRVWTRESTIDALFPIVAPRPLDITDAAIRNLAPGLVLVTYTLTAAWPEARRTTRRSSIWRQGDDGWRVLFHQGTVVPNPETTA